MSPCGDTCRGVSALADTEACDYVPRAVSKHRLMSPHRRREVHFPTSLDAAEQARRLAFDELLSLQLALLARRARACRPCFL